MTQRYFKQLNGLRAFAVVAVIATHTLDTDHRRWIVWGEEGVTLFFVISGFLITGILLDARDSCDLTRSTRRSVLRAFYARRFLRIFPVYYATILVTALLGFQEVRDAFWWYMTYLSNWHLAFDRQWSVATHAWSLAVEEQFYLIWAPVMLAVRKRSLPWLIAGMIAIGPLTRVVLMVTTDMWRPGIYNLTPSAFDALGLGAGLAWAWRSGTGPDRFVRTCAIVGAVLFATNRALAVFGGGEAALAATRISVPLLFVGLVHIASVGIPKPYGRVLDAPAIAYVGTISYGMYLFHPFIEKSVRKAGDPIGVTVPEYGYVLFVGISAITIAMAAISWKYFEAPLNRLKDRFPYTRSTSGVCGAAEVAAMPPPASRG